MYDTKKIILASQSPRRSQILQWANVHFDVVVSASDETYPAGLLPEKVAIHIARNKALTVLHTNKNDDLKQVKNIEEGSFAFQQSIPILAADTIVVLDNDIVGKPVDKEDAIRILQKLSGRKHTVITGVVILFNGNEISFTDKTIVEFHQLTKQQIEFYVNNYHPFDKAGAYAIQEWIGVVGIKSITGDFYNVMGLPISRVLIELDKLKI